MLAIAPGCELDVERGPDWLLVRVRNLDLAESDALRWPSVCGRLLEQHFTYRLVLELDEVRGAEQLLDRAVDPVVSADRRARRRDAAVRSFAVQSPGAASCRWTTDCCPTRTARKP